MLGILFGMARAVSRGMGAATYRELIVWQLADQLRAEIVRLTDSGTAQKDYRFRDQIRSAASSVATNIAEGFSRSSHADFAQFLDYAHGSMSETEDWIRDGIVRHYWSEGDTANARQLFRRLTPALLRLRHYLRATRRPHT